jgi:hypothetical protein
MVIDDARCHAHDERGHERTGAKRYMPTTSVGMAPKNLILTEKNYFTRYFFCAVW